jgi:hypothetical protein
MIYGDVRGRFLEKDFIPPKMQIRSTRGACAGRLCTFHTSTLGKYCNDFSLRENLEDGVDWAEGTIQLGVSSW